MILSPLRFGWMFVLGRYKEDYLQMFKYVPFWFHRVAVVTPTDRPKSVRNRVIEVFGGFFVFALCFMEFLCC